MTPGEIQPVRHGKLFYFFVALMAVLAASGFAYGTVGAQNLIQRLLEALIALVFFAGALQAGNRLVRPANAERNATELSDSGRRRNAGQKMRVTRNALVKIAWALFFVGAVMHVAQNENVSGAGSDMQVFAGVLLFAAWCLADLSGERLRILLRRPVNSNVKDR